MTARAAPPVTIRPWDAARFAELLTQLGPAVFTAERLLERERLRPKEAVYVSLTAGAASVHSCSRD